MTRLLLPDAMLNKIVEGDCLELMGEIAPMSIDAIITDPPFFMPASHYQSRVAWRRDWADTSILKTWWAEVTKPMRRVIKEDGYVLVFCNAESMAVFLPIMFEQWQRVFSLVWDKTRVGLGRLWRHQHELILVACDNAAYMPDDKNLRSDVLSFPATLSRDRKHPVQKPAELMVALIEACTPIDGVVLDPFAGSGTTCRGAKIVGRNYIGFELNAEYANAARELVSLPIQTSLLGIDDD